ncbi:hypothetical protein [Lysobacter enzymogenes]|uniref:hypothetical protein n=1 Tax=Lysobacter enzymogenes TaxID=69 RepID=UPI001A973934|nr:hypothetical protein [Lysobacter enzymogenes]QQP94499.1 hypothetical protein JHW38_14620 [Lysobacter enzymogenes]
MEADVAAIFSEENNTSLLKGLIQTLEQIDVRKMEQKRLPQLLRDAVSIIDQYADIFDELAPSSAERSGQQFFNAIDEFLRTIGLETDEERERDLRNIFSYAYQFLCEAELRPSSRIHFNIDKYSDYVHTHLDDFSGSDRQRLVYATNLMPAFISKQLVRNRELIDLLALPETLKRLNQENESWNKKIDEDLKRAYDLSQRVENLTASYNFVGLNKGFQNLREAKEKESFRAFVFLTFIGAVMIATPIGAWSWTMLAAHSPPLTQMNMIYSAPALITLELLLVYFFRITLSQFKSIKAQLLQIDLRMTLCQFIEKYAEYAIKIRGDDKELLAKFEAIVFSGLAPDESGIPSTFDGMEHLTNLIKSVRGP